METVDLSISSSTPTNKFRKNPSNPRDFFAKLYETVPTVNVTSTSATEKGVLKAISTCSNSPAVEDYKHLICEEKHNQPEVGPLIVNREPAEDETEIWSNCSSSKSLPEEVEEEEKVFQHDLGAMRDIDVSSHSHFLNTNPVLDNHLWSVASASLLRPFANVVPHHLGTAAATLTGIQLSLFQQVSGSGSSGDGIVPPALSSYLARRRRRDGRTRRQRTTFSNDQTLTLELEYQRAEYISRSRRCELAQRLSLTETQIKIWYQNRRAKDKRLEKAQVDQHVRCLASSIALHGASVGITTAAGINNSSSTPSSISLTKAVAKAPQLMSHPSLTTASTAHPQESTSSSLTTHLRMLTNTAAVSQNPNSFLLPYLSGCLSPTLQQLALGMGIPYQNKPQSNNNSSFPSLGIDHSNNISSSVKLQPLTSKAESVTWNPPPVFRSSNLNGNNNIMPSSVSVNTTAISSLVHLNN